MKKLLVGILCFGLIATGCQTKTGTGVLAGGALGAGTGALVAGGKGAAIGGVVGMAAGGLVGAALDEQDRKVMEEKSPRTVERMDKSEPLTVSDIIKLAQGGVNDDTIINYIKKTDTKYNLTQAQIDRLQESGVSQRVINFMIETGK